MADRELLARVLDELQVLVPFYAHSAGRLLSLGADRILMSRFATLSPIDPTVANAFNPQDPVNPVNRIPIAVEDVMAYFVLAGQNGGTGKDHLGRAFLRLAEAVPPLALGNVQRSINQIRQLAAKMIRLHSPSLNTKALDQRVHHLTTALYSHSHFINRREAQEIGLPVIIPAPAVEGLLLDYYAALRDDLELTRKFDPAALLNAVAPPGGGPAGPVTVALERAYIETPTTCDAFVTRGRVSQQQAAQAAIPGMPPGLQPPQPALPFIATFEISSDGWEQLA